MVLQLNLKAKFKKKALREENLNEQKARPKGAKKLAQKAQTRQSARTRLAFLAAAVLILAAEIYIAICVKGSFIRHYAGDVLAVILLYALELAQYFGTVQILGVESKILKVMIGGIFDFADLLRCGLHCKLYTIIQKRQTIF